MKEHFSLPSRGTRAVLALAGLGLFACTSILGVEELSTEPGPPGTSGASGAAGSNGGTGGAPPGAGGSISGVGGSSGVGGDSSGGGGASAGGGGASAGGSAGNAGGAGGATSVDGGPGGSVDGGPGGSVDGGPGGGGGNRSDGGDAGVVTAPITVHGHIIDLWRRPVAGLAVAIGNATATTDAAGAFSVPNIVPPYDAMFSVQWTKINSNLSTHGWLYKGLRRADPTLQVYYANQERDGALHTTLSGVTFPVDTQQVEVGFGSPDGAFEISQDSLEVTFLGQEWWGGPSTTGSVHALSWTHTGTSDFDPPTMYKGYDFAAMTVTESNSPPSTALNLAKTTNIPSSAITGTSPGQVTADRVNHAYVQFTDNATLQLLTDTTTVTSFSYLVPQLTNGTITLTATKGDLYGSFGIVHKDKLAGGAQGVVLTVPTPSNLDTPLEGAKVSATTQFMWSNSANVVSVLRVALDDLSDNVIYVVTTDSTMLFPKFKDVPLQIKTTEVGTWTVQVHGPYTTVDDATGPLGMLDSCYTGALWGPVRDSGSYTRSAIRNVSYAP